MLHTVASQSHDWLHIKAVLYTDWLYVVITVKWLVAYISDLYADWLHITVLLLIGRYYLCRADVDSSSQNLKNHVSMLLVPCPMRHCYESN